jgi:hypothetical protein
MRNLTIIIAALAGCLLSAAPSHAQAIRTWVSGVGDDANPCSRTAPCKTFAGAISKTATGGEISVLDGGGYGVVTIARSLSVMAVGAEGSIVAGSAPGIIVNAQPSDVVQLDGVMLEGGGTGTTGIRILSAAAVHIRNCVIRGFQAEPGLAIDITTTVATRVFISNCAISKNGAGIYVRPGTGGSAQVLLDGVQIETNAGSAVRAEGEPALVWLNRSTITNNGTGLDLASGGTVISFGNNAIAGNAKDGAPSKVQPLQ